MYAVIIKNKRYIDIETFKTYKDAMYYKTYNEYLDDERGIPKKYRSKYKVIKLPRYWRLYRLF